MGLVAGLGLVALGGCGEAVAPKAQAVAEAPPPCNAAAAGVRYEAARKDGVIRGVDLKTQGGPVILVGAVQWRRLSLSDQEAIVAAVDCGIAGPDGHLVSLRVRQDRDGEDMWAMEAGELVALRRRVAARG